jgi:heavy metal sensor kinase
MLTRWNNVSLRLRLTILYVGLLIVLLIALGGFLYNDTRGFLISATASRLHSIANTSISRLSPPTRPEPRPPLFSTDVREPITPTLTINEPTFEFVARNLARDLTWQDYAAIVWDKSGNRIADAGENKNQIIIDIPSPDPGLLARAMQGEKQITYVSTVDGYQILSILIPVNYPRIDSPIVGVVQMITPLDLIDSVMQRQGAVIIIGVALALCLAAVGGLLLTQSSLAPLDLMIETCRRIASGDLSQRVNLPHRKDETGQLAAAFDEMVERLDDSFTTQRQFVADASHELRTPLTAISGSIEVLLLAPEGGDPETTRRVLHGVRREVQRLTRLVSDLLTLTRLDARRPLHMQSVDVAMLGSEVLDNLKSLAKNRALTIETSGNTKCQGDADQLKQVFYNLLGNAVQATDADTGTIVLHIHGSEQGVRVAVKDNGSGIPEQATPHIFERFYRVDKARARASGGSGLGLAIVKAIVEAHGGSIESVESEPGRGTTIRFNLPFGPLKQ